MKTTEELKVLKEEAEALEKKLAELTEEELEQVAGGGQNFWQQPIEDGGKPIVRQNDEKWPYSQNTATDGNHYW